MRNTERGGCSTWPGRFRDEIWTTSLPRPSGLKGFARSAMRHSSDHPTRLSVDTKPADESYFNVLSPVNNEVCTCILLMDLLTLVRDTATLTSVSIDQHLELPRKR